MPKHYPTIGLIGYDPLKVAQLNEEIVNECILRGLKKDQEHPDILAVALNLGKPDHSTRYLTDCAKICAAEGCDIIAIASDIGDSDLPEQITSGLKARSTRHSEIIHQKKLRLKDLAKSIVDRFLDYEKKPKTPNLVYQSEKRNDEEVVAMEKAILDESVMREARFTDLSEHGGLPVLNTAENKGRICFELGGAGPAASAALFTSLIRKGIPTILKCKSSAPGKHAFYSEGGPPFAAHYTDAIRLAKILKANFITIPCNTAHKALDDIFLEFLNDPEHTREKLVDIRQGVLSNMRRGEKFILLGTSATTGVGRQEDGIYEQLRKKINLDSEKFIVPDQEQQAKITKAIFLVKGGTDEEMAEAKKLIDQVIREIKSAHGDHPIVLACTELPLPFSEAEIVEMLDPSKLMAEEVEKRIRQQDLQRMAFSKKTSSRSDKSSSSEADSYSSSGSDSDSKRKRTKFGKPEPEAAAADPGPNPRHPENQGKVTQQSDTQTTATSMSA